MEKLARRAVASPHWRWMKGMTVRNSVDNGVISSCWHEQWHEDGRPKGRPSHVWVQFDEECRAQDIARPGSGDWYPDLTDPATLGCLLALVREAWEPHRGSDYIASTMHTGSGWGVGARYGSEGLAAIVLPTYETEAAALVAALEAAT